MNDLENIDECLGWMKEGRAVCNFVGAQALPSGPVSTTKPADLLPTRKTYSLAMAPSRSRAGTGRTSSKIIKSRFG